MAEATGMTPERIMREITDSTSTLATRKYVDSKTAAAIRAGEIAPPAADRAVAAASEVRSDRETVETHRAAIDSTKDTILSYVYSQTDGEDATILGVVSNPNSQTNEWLESSLATKEEYEALEARTAPQKILFGLPVPQMHRAPSLGIVDVVPDSQIDAQVLMAEGDTLWAQGRDASLYKSTAGGGVWEHISYHPTGIQTRGGLTRCPDGSLLLFTTSFTIRRSTDEGKTWTDVLPRRAAGAQPLTTQSMAVNQETGHVFYGEYIMGASDGKAVLWRSVDNGATWQEHYSWPTVEGQPNRISHIHGVQYDPIGKEVYVMTGDVFDAVGFWKVSGNTCVPVLTNADLVGVSDSVGNFFDAPRAIGMMFFPDYIAWASDSTSSPYVFRIPRSAFGTDPTKIERVARMSSTSWGTIRASEDGSRWVVFSSDESFPTQAADRFAHIYSVEDQGATVYEVGAIASQSLSSSTVATLQPAGLAENFGEYFWFNMRTGGNQSAAWKARLGYGGQTIPWPSRKPTPIVQSQSSGIVTLEPSSSVAFGSTRTPAFARKFAIYDAMLTRLAGDAGNIGIRVKDGDGNVIYLWASSPSARQAKRAEHGGPIFMQTLSANETVTFEAYNIRLTTTAVLSGTFTYAFLAQ